jgi:hypothetical protein
LPLWPQAGADVPAWHSPLSSQQPVQVVALHSRHTPLDEHLSPEEQAMHDEPEPPQAVSSVPSRHVPSLAQHPLQFDGPQDLLLDPSSSSLPRPSLPQPKTNRTKTIASARMGTPGAGVTPDVQ